jgi:hypothetical protein
MKVYHQRRLFNMEGRVAVDATQIVWKAYQTYQDGTVVEWIGAEAECSAIPFSVHLSSPHYCDDLQT